MGGIEKLQFEHAETLHILNFEMKKISEHCQSVTRKLLRVRINNLELMK